MGNTEERHELIGKTGRGNTSDGAAKDVAAVEGDQGFVCSGSSCAQPTAQQDQLRCFL